MMLMIMLMMLMMIMHQVVVSVDLRDDLGAGWLSWCGLWVWWREFENSHDKCLLSLQSFGDAF